MFDPARLGTFGYRPDPPAKDAVFSADLRPKLQTAFGGDVDLRPYTSQTNQYSLGSCVGNATADAVEILNAIAGLPPVQLSRLFIYTLARNLMDEDGDGRADIDRDEGTYPRLAFDVLTKFGVCREDIGVERGGWPYDLSKVYTLPSLKSMRAATGHRIHSYYRITESGADRVDAVIAALRANHPVVMGTKVEKSFLSVSSAAPVAPPKGETIGGHALIIVGYLQAQGFIVKNSWGPNWGDNGCCIMEPEYIVWSGTSDLWVPTMGTMFR